MYVIESFVGVKTMKVQTMLIVWHFRNMHEQTKMSRYFADINHLRESHCYSGINKFQIHKCNKSANQVMKEQYIAEI